MTTHKHTQCLFRRKDIIHAFFLGTGIINIIKYKKNSYYSKIFTDLV